MNTLKTIVCFSLLAVARSINHQDELKHPKFLIRVAPMPEPQPTRNDQQVHIHEYTGFSENTPEHHNFPQVKFEHIIPVYEQTKDITVNSNQPVAIKGKDSKGNSQDQGLRPERPVPVNNDEQWNSIEGLPEKSLPEYDMEFKIVVNRKDDIQQQKLQEHIIQHQVPSMSYQYFTMHFGPQRIIRMPVIYYHQGIDKSHYH